METVSVKEIRTQQELLDHARQGDADAFAELFEGYRRLIFAVACRVVGPDEADDVTMETFLKAWKALPRFDGRSSLKTWLYRISRNCALDFVRSRKRQQARILPMNDQDERQISDLEDVRQPLPDHALVQGERHALVRRALERVGDPHRSTLLLRYADEQSYADIAAATGVSIGTVMSRLYNGKRKLKQIIEEVDAES